MFTLGTVFIAIGIYVFWVRQIAHSTRIDILIYFLQQSILVYLADAFVPFGASAVASATLLRSCAGCGFPLFGKQMFRGLGYGWTCTVMVIVLIPSMPIPWYDQSTNVWLDYNCVGYRIMYYRGRSLRERYPFKG